MLVQNEESFAQLHEASLKSLREGKQAAVLPMQMRRTGTEGEAVTGQHFLTYRAEQSSTADGTYWIRRVPQPILMLRDGGDSLIQPFEPYMLLSAATAPGSLVPSIKPKSFLKKGLRALAFVSGAARISKQSPLVHWLA